MTNGIYLLLGSNLGDRMANMAKALDLIEKEVGQVISQSQLYETDAWGIKEQDSFLNQVIEIATNLNAHALLKQILEIEKTMGRERIEKWGERLIDLDILYYGNMIIEEAELKIPHPHIAERRFTLVPLCEIAPLLVHPVTRKNQLELLKECSDPLEARIFKPE